MNKIGLWAIALVLLVACEGDDDGGGSHSGISSCGEFQACGGDIVGTWNVEGVCTDDLEAFIGGRIEEPACANTVVHVEVDASGSYTFAADGTVTFMRVMAFEMHSVWTPACLAALGNLETVDVPATCGNLDESYRMDPDYTSASCVYDGTNCACMITGTIERTGTDNYQVSGTRVLQSDSEPADYCIEGNTLRVVQHQDGADSLITFTRVP